MPRMYLEAFRQFSKQLGQVETWFDAAAAHADAKKFDPNLYLTFRLAPDQFALVRQVQVACDTAKMAAARLAGKEAPVQPDTEATLADLRARVQSVRTYLGTFTAKDFESAATRVISQPRWEGKTMTGADYFREHVTPNFFFHLTTAYAILRNNGVALGKKDYLGPLTQTLPA
jgi:hypothetical protein